ncbi:spexin prohormone 2-like [Lepisosteus oculatus]|uniref:spexin prohormone 2-like n=1 Tax=Lepisosteus oculatus TaxID=7918 RepID=UPI00073FFB79|nr:PREDICTED: spexin-like [Lepisosteus oculatus]
MKPRATFLWTCTFAIIFIVMESPSASKTPNKMNSRNWGPQSMMYLKGKYGRRYVSDYDEDQFEKFGLNNWNALLKGYQKLRPVEYKNIRRMLTAEKVEIRYLE